MAKEFGRFFHKIFSCGQIVVAIVYSFAFLLFFGGAVARGVVTKDYSEINDLRSVDAKNYTLFPPATKCKIGSFCALVAQKKFLEDLLSTKSNVIEPEFTTNSISDVENFLARTANCKNLSFSDEGFVGKNANPDHNSEGFYQDWWVPTRDFNVYDISSIVPGTIVFEGGGYIDSNVETTDDRPDRLSEADEYIDAQEDPNKKYILNKFPFSSITFSLSKVDCSVLSTYYLIKPTDDIASSKSKKTKNIFLPETSVSSVVKFKNKLFLVNFYSDSYKNDIVNNIQVFYLACNLSSARCEYDYYLKTEK